MTIHTVNPNEAEEDDEEMGVFDYLSKYNTQLLVVVGFIILYFVLEGVNIPPFWVGVLQYGIGGLVIVYLAGDKILDHIQPPDNNYVLIGNLETKKPAQLRNWGSQTLRDLEMEEGELMRDGHLYVLTEYNEETHTAKGTWIGELSTIELIKFRTNLRAARQIMQEEMLEGIAKQEAAKIALQSGIREFIQVFSAKLISKTTMDGVDINEIMTEAVDDANLANISDELAEEAGVDEAMELDMQEVKEDLKSDLSTSETPQSGPE